MASTEFEPYLSVSPICEIGSLITKRKEKKGRKGKNQFINGTPRCNISSKVQILEKSKVLTVKSRSETHFE